MRKSSSAWALVIAVLVPGGLWAHTDEQLAAMKAPHGGQLRVAGPYHLELVSKNHSLTLYVTDHAWFGQDTRGGEGKATMTIGAQALSVPLTPNGSNTLRGTCKVQPRRDTVIVVVVMLAGREPQIAQFGPLK